MLSLLSPKTLNPLYIFPRNSSVRALCIILLQQASWTFVWLGEGESIDSKFEMQSNSWWTANNIVICVYSHNTFRRKLILKFNYCAMQYYVGQIEIHEFFCTFKSLLFLFAS